MGITRRGIVALVAGIMLEPSSARAVATPSTERDPGAGLSQQGPTIADCDAVYGYFRANQGYVVEYDTVAPLLDSLLDGGYAERDLLAGYGERFHYLSELHAGMTPPWQLQDFHQNVIGLYYNAEGAFQNFDVALHGGFMALILGPTEAEGRAVALDNARSFAYEAARLRGLIATTATGWQDACAIYNG